MRQDAGSAVAHGVIRHRECSCILRPATQHGIGFVVESRKIRRRDPRALYEFELPLDVLVVRKIGHPLQREFAIGALAEPDFVFLNEESLREFPAAKSDFDKVIAEEKNRLGDYRRRFHLSEMPPLEGKIILLVDDGLATGATAEAAAISTRRQNAKKILIAAPVASPQTVGRLRRVADEVLVLFEDFNFQAVGQYYEEFSQTTDDEVIALLKKIH